MEDIAEYHFKLAQILCDMANHDEAETEFNAAMERDPDNGFYRANYSFLLLKEGQLAKAQDEAKRAVELSPDDIYSLHMMGVMSYFSNQLGEAEDALREAVRLDTDNSHHHTALGSVLFQAGRYREALKQHELAIASFDSFDGPFSLALYHANASAALTALHRYEEALVHAEQAIALDPNDPDYHYLRCALLTCFNRTEEARQELETAYDLAGLPLPEELL